MVLRPFCLCTKFDAGPRRQWQAGIPRKAGSAHRGAAPARPASLIELLIEPTITPVLEGNRTEKVIDSIHSRDEMYCVDVVATPHGFKLQTCRRDEGRWQVIGRPSEYQDRGEATAAARALIANFE